MPETIRIGAPTPSGSFLTVVAESGVSGEQAVRNLLPHNELYWPPPVQSGSAYDLDAQNLWWHKVGTPTGGTIYTTATAASISTLYGDDLLKCVAAASGDGLKTTWTYASEKRVKSGAYLAAICAVYLVTAARTVTISLVDSTAATTASATVTTTGSWQLVALEPGANTLAGTSVDFKATLDGAGTFYVIPLGAQVSTAASPRALPLPFRGMVYRNIDQTNIVSNVDPNATWTTADATSAASALAAILDLQAFYGNQSAVGSDLGVRRKGASVGSRNLVRNTAASVNLLAGNGLCVCDDQQRIEYIGSATVAHTENVYLYVTGYWEWA